IFPDAAWCQTTADGTRAAVHHGTVGHAETAESVALHHARESAALGGADHIHPLVFREEIRPDFRPRRRSFRVFQTELTIMVFRGNARFPAVAEVRLVGAFFS